MEKCVYFFLLNLREKRIINNDEGSFLTAENSIKTSCYARHILLILNVHSIEQISRLVWGVRFINSVDFFSASDTKKIKKNHETVKQSPRSWACGKEIH